MGTAGTSSMSISSLARPDPTFPSAASPPDRRKVQPATRYHNRHRDYRPYDQTYLANHIHATTVLTPRPRLRLRHGHHQWLDLLLTTTLLTRSSIVKLLIRQPSRPRYPSTAPSLRHRYDILLYRPGEPRAALSTSCAESYRNHAGRTLRCEHSSARPGVYI